MGYISRYHEKRSSTHAVSNNLISHTICTINRHRYFYFPAVPHCLQPVSAESNTWISLKMQKIIIHTILKIYPHFEEICSTRFLKNNFSKPGIHLNRKLTLKLTPASYKKSPDAAAEKSPLTKTWLLFQFQKHLIPFYDTL